MIKLRHRRNVMIHCTFSLLKKSFLCQRIFDFFTSLTSLAFSKQHFSSISHKVPICIHLYSFSPTVVNFHPKKKDLEKQRCLKSIPRWRRQSGKGGCAVSTGAILTFSIIIANIVIDSMYSIRDAKSCRCCRYICAIFFSWC